MLNQNWLRRQEVKYQYQIKRAKLTNKYKKEGKASLTPKEEGGALSSFKSLLPVLSKLDGDQVSDLADKFLGTGEVGEGSGMTDLVLDFAEHNPEMVSAFLKGIGKTKEAVSGETFTEQ